MLCFCFYCFLYCECPSSTLSEVLTTKLNNQKQLEIKNLKNLLKIDQKRTEIATLIFSCVKVESYTTFISGLIN